MQVSISIFTIQALGLPANDKEIPKASKEPLTPLKMDIPKDPLFHLISPHLTALLHHIITENNPPGTEVHLA